MLCSNTVMWWRSSKKINYCILSRAVSANPCVSVSQNSVVPFIMQLSCISEIWCIIWVFWENFQIEKALLQFASFISGCFICCFHLFFVYMFRSNVVGSCIKCVIPVSYLCIPLLFPTKENLIFWTEKSCVPFITP